VPQGRPAEQLLDLSEQEHAHLVVAGSRGLARLKRAALGSVSDKLARYAVAALVGKSRS
jgi:nucleotide-binding universal stress UspA family protein